MGSVLWVLKSGEKLHGKVLGLYPYYVEIDLSSGENLCTCPKGGDCDHVELVREAYKRGAYFSDHSRLSQVEPEAAVWDFLLQVPELAVEVSVKELISALKRDESGSETAKLFFRTGRLVELSGRFEYLHILEEAWEEFSRVFPDYPVSEKIQEMIGELKELSRKAL
jgi:uncharacterized Zn finger protein